MTSALSDAGANQQSSVLDADTSAQPGTGYGVGQHYWVVTLTPPAGASTALQQFVLMGQDAIQTSVDLLGRGTTELPPVVDDLLQTMTYQDLGSGSANSDYQALLSAIQDRQQTLLSKDNEVMQASITVSASTDSTLKYIESVVNELQSEFDAITGKLTAAEETALMQQIGVAIDIVNARVTSVYESNNAIAGTGAASDTGSDTGSTGSDASDTTSGQTADTSSGSGSSGDSSGLSSIMEMLPMLAMPLMSLAPELLKDLTKAFAPGQQNQNSGNGTAQQGNGATSQQGNGTAPQGIGATPQQGNGTASQQANSATPQQGNGTAPRTGTAQVPAQNPAANPATFTIPNTGQTKNTGQTNRPTGTPNASTEDTSSTADPSTAEQTAS
jgi:hypothetical protein